MHSAVTPPQGSKYVSPSLESDVKNERVGGDVLILRIIQWESVVVVRSGGDSRGGGLCVRYIYIRYILTLTTWVYRATRGENSSVECDSSSRILARLTPDANGD